MRAALAALVLSGCVSHRGPWTVQGGSDSEQRQALAITEAAKRVYPGTSLDDGGRIFITSDAATTCYGLWGQGKSIAGCNVPGGVVVLWPHPKCPQGADLTCSALAHELAHRAFAENEGAADAGALLITLEYRRAVP